MKLSNEGWIKLNFDVVSKRNLGLSSVGCIFRNHDVSMIGVVPKKLSIVTKKWSEISSNFLGFKNWFQIGREKINNRRGFFINN